MITIVLLGYGNVGQHLYNVMEAAKDVDVVQVYNRTKHKTLKTPQTQDLKALVSADVYIIAIPDDAIGEFSESLPFKNRLVVHTSGGAHMDVLSSNNLRGIFYPLQTFSKITKVDFSTIPICVEAENEADLQLLKKLGDCISEKVVEISSSAREKLHVAAVFVNNFTNHLYHIAETITAENKLDFNLLKPLITETARKIETLSPAQAQTGPAKRNDKKTIEKHLKLLENSKYRDLYEHLTESIENSGE
ncbi:Rossmann-like and DUF2520 domain-containing protein [Rasiella sp. SM2506]|uniref:Rossmann-like and DUF2520 domain-containing protein n=1 Tax=Rasiella sp. SM2506 TaxID=3423914 RepID=UPI003D7B23ED